MTAALASEVSMCFSVYFGICYVMACAFTRIYSAVNQTLSELTGCDTL